jgi:hypothetical protein
LSIWLLLVAVAVVMVRLDFQTKQVVVVQAVIAHL